MCCEVNIQGDVEDDHAVAPQHVERLYPFPWPEGQRVGLPRVAEDSGGGGVDPHECIFREHEVPPLAELRGDDFHNVRRVHTYYGVARLER